MFLSNTSFSVKLQPIDCRSATLLDKEWQRYLAKIFPKLYKEISCRNTWGNLCGGAWKIVFWNMFWKESVVNSGYSRIAVSATQTYNFIKTKPIAHVFGKFFKLSQSSISICANISICVEESSHIKDHMWFRIEAPSFCINCPLIWNIC